MSPELTLIMVAIISSVTSIVTTVIQVKEKREPQYSTNDPKRIKSDRKALRLKIVSGIGIVVAVVAVGVLIWQLTLSPQIAITSPTEGATVDQRQQVKGTSSHIPQNQKMGVLVYGTTSGRYYYQQDVTEFRANGNWVATAGFGNQGDGGGYKLDVLVVLMDQKAYDTIKAESEADRKNLDGLEGFPNLPEGAVTYDRITVTRK